MNVNRFLLCFMCLVICSILKADEIKFYPLSCNKATTESHPGLWMCLSLEKAKNFGENKSRMFATNDAVTDGIALKVNVMKGFRGILEMQDDDYPENTVGITFYIKASQKLKMSVNMDKTKFDFEATKGWTKINIPWSKLGTTKEKRKIDYWFKIGFSKSIDKDCWYIIDRLGTEGPEFSKPIDIPAIKNIDQKINSKDLSGNIKALSGIQNQLKNKKPFKIIAFGDSISFGAQIDRGNRFYRKLSPNEKMKYLYFGRLANMLEKQFGWQGIKTVQHGIPSRSASDSLKRLPKVLKDVNKNDLLIIEFGANDLNRKPSVDQWLADLKVLIDLSKKKTPNILIMSPTTGGKANSLFKEIRKKFPAFAEKNNVAWADVNYWSLCRGEKFGWAYLANGSHPEMMGHEQLAEIILPLFTNKHFNWPE